MSHAKRWETIRTLGSGGQGTVMLVRDKTKFNSQEIQESLRRSLRQITSAMVPDRQDAVFGEFQAAWSAMINCDDPRNLGALKQLHPATDARDPERAKERIAREFKAMSEAEHPNLLKVIDGDIDADWFVTEFHSGGTLSQNLDIAKGDAEKALELIRPLVLAVQSLHERKIVHRDIKPQNIFVGSNKQFILGDFGLVYFDDDHHTRLSGTLENVGTRDWMPGWAMGMRVEDVRPSFDVFALGKILWALISARSVLRLWYYRRPENDLTVMFPKSPHMSKVNQILSRCIVEEDEDCLPDATALLAEIDAALVSIRGRATVFAGVQGRTCTECAVGTYQELSQHEINNSGMGTPSGQRKQKIFSCSDCGHIQRFLSPESKRPRLWDNIV